MRRGGGELQRSCFAHDHSVSGCSVARAGPAAPRTSSCLLQTAAAHATKTTSERVLRPAVNRANELRAGRDLPQLPPTSPHALRRTYISLKIEAGAPVPYAMRQVGHEDPRRNGPVVRGSGPQTQTSSPEDDAQPDQPQQKPRKCEAFGSGARGTRTPDLLGAIQALSQLSYSPVRRHRPRGRPSLAPRRGLTGMAH